MAETVAERLAEFGDSLCYERIPAQVIEKAKDLVLDTLGICFASSRMGFGRAVQSLVAGWEGVPESSLIGTNAKVPAQHAALANGVLAHGQDYDDTHTEAVVHPSACLVPVALAAGERAGASGKEVLAALVGGAEVMIRIGMPARNKFHLRGFHATSICGTFAAALVAAKLMGVGRDTMAEALGIAGSFTSGLLETIPAGSSAKRLHPGWAGHGGIVAAALAQASYTGPRTVFEGHLGLYSAFLGPEPLDLAAIFKGLGTEWEALNIRPKLYPCCHYLQAYLDCASRLRRSHRFGAGEIAKIECKVAPGAVHIVCEPWEKKLSPASSYDARFSLPFAVSLMLARGRAGAREFSDADLDDAEIADLMARVSYEADPSLQVKDMPGSVSVTLKSGDRLEHRIDRVRGDALAPIHREELLEKFHENTLALGRDRSQRIAERLLGFDRLKGVGEALEEFA